MTIHRFFINPQLIELEKELVVSEDVSHQIAQVLRLKKGDQIIVLDGSGFEYLCLIAELDKKHTQIKIVKKHQNNNEPELKIHLYQALISRENFELILQKSVELGVVEVTPIQTERSQMSIAWATERKERFEKIIREAAEQSERGKLPILNNPLNYQSAIEQACENGDTLIAWEKEPNDNNKITSNFKDNQLNIFVGPEGGFTEEEISFAQQKGVQTKSLGKTILRAETASIAIIAKLLL